MKADEIDYLDNSDNNFDNSNNISHGEKSEQSRPKLIDRYQLTGNGLSHSQNILLMTDGTVTELLEYLSRETIVIEKLHQEIESTFDNIPISHHSQIVDNELPALVRKILLKGKITNNNYIYAESSILLNNLPEKFRYDLVHSHTPIGKLWSKHRCETYKTNFVVKCNKANNNISKILSIPVNSDVLSRTYSVYTCGKISMVITEMFSASCFSD